MRKILRNIEKNSVQIKNLDQTLTYSLIYSVLSSVFNDIINKASGVVEIHTNLLEESKVVAWGGRCGQYDNQNPQKRSDAGRFFIASYALGKY